ncbi:hypothetical protein [Lonsdalea populi]|uniref:hypothetical protein n=1 Tax=Lonsdalea populi TaxID=1172565 RepID=UPI0015939B19|nr:hypothetical protein [Lonsdalea populi]
MSSWWICPTLFADKGFIAPAAGKPGKSPWDCGAAVDAQPLKTCLTTYALRQVYDTPLGYFLERLLRLTQLTQ